MKAKKSKRGLSLLELLLNIAIISILLAVLIVGIFKARVRAFDANTQSYLHNLVVAQIDHFMHAGVFATSESDLLGAPYKSPYIHLEAWVIGVNDFCIQARYNSLGTSSFFSRSSGELFSGSCP
ncbi:MAG: prepilin-type N-terminal cleavage/methylation domain-containing protein [Deinococcales bacterium]